MASTINLLYRRSYPINDKISIVIPTVGEILDDEDGYYSLLTMFTAAPIDMMVQLDDVGIDFTELNDFELFAILFNALKDEDTSLILGDLDLSEFVFATSQQNGQLVIYNPERDIVIDRAIHQKIAVTLRTIHHLKRDRRKPGNKEAKEYMLERARIKMKRNKNKQMDSQLEQLIVALVNTEQFKYDYDTVRNLSIYQFNESVQQIIHKIDYEHRMNGVYAGTVDPKKMSQDEFNWLVHK